MLEDNKRIKELAAALASRKPEALKRDRPFQILMDDALAKAWFREEEELRKIEEKMRNIKKDIV